MSSTQAIAFVCHSYHRGGVTEWMKEAYLELKRQKTECYFVTVKAKRDFFGGSRPQMRELLSDVGHEVISSEVGLSFELGTDQFRAMAYARLVMKNVPTGAVLIPSDDPACWMACAAVADKYKMIGVLHSDEEKYYTLLQAYSRFLSGYIAVSGRIQNKITLAENDLPPGKIIPCGVDTSRFYSDEKKQSIVWVGRIEERQKRVSDIPLICSELVRNGMEFSCLVFGSGGDDAFLRERIGEKGLADTVQVMGWADSKAIAQVLASAKILLQTSNFEGMSVVVMEALASGCAIVSSRVSGIEDMEFVPGAQGVINLYDTGDVQVAAKLIQGVLQNFDSTMASKAKELANRYYSIGACMQAYVEFAKAIKPAQSAYTLRNSFYVSWHSIILSLLRYSKWRLTVKNICVE